MQYEDIKGDVTVPGFIGAIELQSAQIAPHRSVSQTTGRQGSREASAPNISEIIVTKNQDSASSSLFRASLMGEGKKVKIDFCKTDNNVPVPYMTIELENTLISNYSISGSGGDSQSRPMESLSLNFTKITFKTGSVAQLQNAGKQGYAYA
jgi:type VI secretion system secreted protein Hcp